MSKFVSQLMLLLLLGTVAQWPSFQFLPKRKTRQDLLAARPRTFDNRFRQQSEAKYRKVVKPDVVNRERETSW